MAIAIAPYTLKALTFFASSIRSCPMRRATRLPPPIPNRLDIATFIRTIVSVRDVAAIMYEFPVLPIKNASTIL